MWPDSYEMTDTHDRHPSQLVHLLDECHLALNDGSIAANYGIMTVNFRSPQGRRGRITRPEAATMPVYPYFYFLTRPS